MSCVAPSNGGDRDERQDRTRIQVVPGSRSAERDADERGGDRELHQHDEKLLRLVQLQRGRPEELERVREAEDADDQNAAWSFGIPMFLNMMFATLPTVT